MLIVISEYLKVKDISYVFSVLPSTLTSTVNTARNPLYVGVSIILITESSGRVRIPDPSNFSFLPMPGTELVPFNLKNVGEIPAYPIAKAVNATNALVSLDMLLYSSGIPNSSKLSPKINSCAT